MKTSVKSLVLTKDDPNYDWKGVPMICCDAVEKLLGGLLPEKIRVHVSAAKTELSSMEVTLTWRNDGYGACGMSCEVLGGQNCAWNHAFHRAKEMLDIPTSVLEFSFFFSIEAA